MASVWAGYRCSLLGFVLFATTFTLIISAQNIETGRLVDGGNTKRVTVGFASISSNKPAPNTCHGGPKSAWDICAASQGMLALLALTTIALIGHTGMMVVMTIKLSRRTEESVWRVMAWELDDKLRPRPERVITTTNVTMSGVEAGVIQERPVSKVLPPVPMGMVEDPPRARNPLTFSTVSSLLNPAPRDLPGSARQEGRFQLHDGPAPVPVERPPVQRAFERISGYIHDDPHNAPSGFGGFSMYYAPTPVYDRFARGMSEAFPSSGVGTPVTPALKPPSPLQPRKIQKKDGRWMLADESDALERPLVGEDRPTLPARFQSRMHEIQPPAAAQVTPVRRPSRTPPRIMPGTLPNPNSYRPILEDI
ncbi:hypothetical protein RhiTH_006251 [Rhizoctonia solani]